VNRVALNTELSTRLDAGTLVQSFLGRVGGSASTLNGITPPANSDRLSEAGQSGGSFLPAPIQEAVVRFASNELPIPNAPATLARIEHALGAIEQLTTHDIGREFSDLVNTITTELSGSNAQGLPGTLLRLAELLRSSTGWSALSNILGVFLAPGSVTLPAHLEEYLPAFASTARVAAGLSVYETVLAEGERLSTVVAGSFQGAAAEAAKIALATALAPDGHALSNQLGSIELGDGAGIDALAARVETAAACLEALDAYCSQGMGFGEATLVHFDVTRAQAEVTLAGSLLHDPDLGGLRRIGESLAQLLSPILSAMDPGTAAARGIDEALSLAEAQLSQAAQAIQNLDASALVSPLSTGLQTITAPLRDFNNLLSGLVSEVRSALEQVRSAIAALPIDDIINTIHDALAPVTRALEFLRDLIEEIKEALDAAAALALSALGTVESVVDQFRQEILDLFGQAQKFIDDLHLDQVIASIGDKVSEFVNLLHQAQLKPYFDTASSAIGTAADVISKVPLNLLPESMKSDLDAALAPVREVDAGAVEAKIESLLQIGADGKFQLRGDLEHALAEIQQKFEELITTLDDHHPSKYLDQIDEQLTAVAARISEISPALTLEPVQTAIAQLKNELAGFDLEHELAPVQSVFDNALQKLDEYSPAALLRPIEQRVTEARQSIKTMIRVDDWLPLLDRIAGAGLGPLNALDPDALEPLLASLLDKLRSELATLPSFGFARVLGTIVSGLMRGSDLRLDPQSMTSVLRWLTTGTPPSSDLSTRAGRIADSLAEARVELDRFEPASLAAITTQADGVRTAALALATRLPADAAARLQAAAERLDVAGVVARMSANRTRYLALLASAAALGDGLRRTGFSEADVAVTQLRAAFDPLAPIGRKLRQLTTYLGIGDGGLASALRSIFSVATPARLVGVIMPLFRALRARLQTLIAEVVTPVRASAAELVHLVDLLDLTPVIEAIDAVFRQVRGELASFSPSVLLHDQLAAFAALQQTLRDFDPLADILHVLDAVRDTAARLVQKLSAHALLESPLAIYDTIVGAIRQLDVETLLSPVLDELDNIATQVDDGLDETVAAFKRLQESLPAPSGSGGQGGGGTLAVSGGIG